MAFSTAVPPPATSFHPFNPTPSLLHSRCLVGELGRCDSGSQGDNLRCLKDTGQPRGKKNTDRWMDGWMDGCHLGTWYKLYFNDHSNQHREPKKAPPRPSRQPHGSHLAPEEVRSEAGTCLPTWMTRRKQNLKRKPKGQNPLQFGEQHIYKSK